jgi:hypothetical protein
MVFYENALAINDLSINVRAGEIVGIIGSNSAGKNDQCASAQSHAYVFAGFLNVRIIGFPLFIDKCPQNRKKIFLPLYLINNYQFFLEMTKECLCILQFIKVFLKLQVQV